MAIKTRIISFIWGLSEATFFFLVPDIRLSQIAIENKKEAYINIAFVTLGAILGGLLLYVLSISYFENIQKYLTFIPAISSENVQAVGHNIEKNGFFKPLIMAGFTGVPYKIYASWSGHLQIPLFLFILSSIIARISRFLLVTMIVHFVSIVLSKHMSIKRIHIINLLCWLVFYIFYFKINM